MRSSLPKGDEIITIGGIIGRIDAVKEDTIVITINSSHTKMEIVKTAVGSVRNRAEQKKAAEPAEEKEDTKAASNNRKVIPKRLGARKSTEEITEETKD